MKVSIILLGFLSCKGSPTIKQQVSPILSDAKDSLLPQWRGFVYPNLYDLAASHSQIYKPPYNTILPRQRREIILRENQADEKGDIWKEAKRYIIQSVSNYPNRYFVADTTDSFNFSLMDISFQPSEDSFRLVNMINGKYLGEWSDKDAPENPKIILEVNHKCEEKNAFNYTHVLILYHFNENGLKAEKILDFCCTDSGRAYDGTCFCEKDRATFEKQLYKDLVLQNSTVFTPRPFPRIKKIFHPK